MSRVRGEPVTFISPQLASPVPSRWFDDDPARWIIEEKYDGHRLVVSTAETGGGLFGKPTTRAWSRYGAERPLPAHVLAAIEILPSGVYDGELVVPGRRSYGVTELVNGPRLQYVVFDVLQLLGRDTTSFPLIERRRYLEEIFRKKQERPGLDLSWQRRFNNWADVQRVADEVWARDGEGLIVKRVDKPYRPGKRVKDWVKVKQLRSAVLTVIGYKAGRLGPHATIVLRDEDGNETTVKTLNDQERGALDRGAAAGRIGQRLRIDFQERTPEGGYRHPRMDRWENE